MKQPINLLLYTASVGMLGTAGYEFYRAVPDLGGAKRLQDAHAEGQSFSADTITDSQENGRQTPAWDYRRPYWENFARVNFTGKLPPKPIIPQDPGPQTTVVKPTEKPLQDIISIVGLIRSSGDDASRVQVRYKEGSGVQIPPEFLAAARMDASAGAVGAVGSATLRQPGSLGVPRSQRGRSRNRNGVVDPGADTGNDTARQNAPTPTLGGTAEVVQRLEPGDSLWEPFEHISFQRVADDAYSAYFVRRTDDGEKEEQLLRTQYDLDHEMLREWLAAGSGDGPEGERPSPPRAPSGNSAWFDTEDTVVLDGRPNERVVGRRDSEMFRNNPDQLFEQVNLQPYTFTTGAYKGRRGLQVANVDPQLARRFGVSSGDVIISVNGEAVSSKAAAIKHGQREYDRGVRVFRVEVLSYGAVETRVYHAEDS